MTKAVGRTTGRRGLRNQPGVDGGPDKVARAAGTGRGASASANVVHAMPKQTTDVDRLVGLRITALRKDRGLSQTKLGEAIGVTFQQVQKYEKGQNRVGAGRLRDIAQLLGVPVSAFFDEETAPGKLDADAFSFLRVNGAMDLLRGFAAISDDQVRRDVVALVRSLAKAQARAAG